MNRVEARAPCRIDLAGGTLDIWPLGHLHQDSRTVNVAIDVRATVALERSDDGRYRVRQGDEIVEAASPAELADSVGGALIGRLLEALDLPAVEVSIESGSPRGAGLGGSSAIAVALIGAADALLDVERNARESAALARDVEARLMQLPTGLQDHYPPLLGGALEIRYEAGGERVRTLDVDLEALGDVLTVAYTGQSHFSAGANWEIVRRRLDGDADVAAALEGVAAAARRLGERLEAGDLRAVGELVGEEWRCRRRLSPGVSTDTIETFLRVAAEAGAWGGKACGAGGGGCVVVVGPAERRAAIEGALDAVGAERLPARPVASGLEVRRGGGAT